jgi:hypothetical protein
MSEAIPIRDPESAEQLIEVLDAAIAELEKPPLVLSGHKAARINGRLGHLRELCAELLSEDN